MIVLFTLSLIAFIYILYKKKTWFGKVKEFILILVVCFFVFNIILYPQEVFEAAKSGINTWFHIVFPALLPFFIGAELLIGLGVVRFIGILLEPIVRPIFNVPGEGSFVLAMSITSGYPMGIKLASELRNQGIFTKEEGQRLISFCSTSGPLFMIGAVAIGMFHNLQLGSMIAISHYLGAIATGICFRFYKYNIANTYKFHSQNAYIKRAFCELLNILQKREKPFGFLLGMAVKNSIETLLIVGGFIILFSVIIRFLDILGFIPYIADTIYTRGYFFSIDKKIYEAILSGVFEITIGCKILSEVQDIQFIQQAVLTSMIISWSGFSIHAQAASLISKTDLSISVYIFSKLLHAVFAGIFVLLITPITQLIFQTVDKPVFLYYALNINLPNWLEKFIFSSELFLSIITFIIVIAVVIYILLLICKFIVISSNK